MPFSIIEAHELEEGDIVIEDDGEYAIVSLCEMVSGIHAIVEHDGAEHEFVYAIQDDVKVQA